MSGTSAHTLSTKREIREQAKAVLQSYEEDGTIDQEELKALIKVASDTASTTPIAARAVEQAAVKALLDYLQQHNASADLVAKIEARLSALSTTANDANTTTTTASSTAEGGATAAASNSATAMSSSAGGGGGDRTPASSTTTASGAARLSFGAFKERMAKKREELKTARSGEAEKETSPVPTGGAATPQASPGDGGSALAAPSDTATNPRPDDGTEAQDSVYPSTTQSPALAATLAAPHTVPSLDGDEGHPSSLPHHPPPTTTEGGENATTAPGDDDETRSHSHRPQSVQAPVEKKPRTEAAPKGPAVVLTAAPLLEDDLYAGLPLGHRGRGRGRGRGGGYRGRGSGSGGGGPGEWRGGWRGRGGPPGPPPPHGYDNAYGGYPSNPTRPYYGRGGDTGSGGGGYIAYRGGPARYSPPPPPPPPQHQQQHPLQQNQQPPPQRPYRPYY